MRKPHLWPPNMPVTRLAHFANAADVDTVIVDGKVLISNRRPTQVDETSILQEAATALTQALQLTGLEHLTTEPTDYWQTARRHTEGFPVRD